MAAVRMTVLPSVCEVISDDRDCGRDEELSEG